jgi:VCBS repeat-containing protein
MADWIGTDGNDTHTGTSGDDHIDGGNGNDSLAGGAGSDTILGGAGNDTLVGGEDDYLFGGTGNDYYLLDSEKLMIFEDLGSGFDTVGSTASIELGANIEALELLGSAQIWGMGNVLDNTILGNSADNELMGLGGNDTINGGSGGWDTAWYTGTMAEYEVTVLPGGQICVMHLNGGADGTDYLTNIDAIVFTDGTIYTDHLATNGAPVASDDGFAVAENGVAQLDVLANDTDPDPGDTLTILTASVASGLGSVAIQNGQLSYDPGTAYDHLAAGQTANVQIVYTIGDGQGGTSQASCVLVVTGSNDGPVVHAKSFNVGADTQLAGNVLLDTGSGADSDVDGGTLSVTAGTYATAGGGSVVIGADGGFVYTPAAGYAGADSFGYTVGDGQGGFATGTVALTVAPFVGNHAPIAAGDSFNVGENGVFVLDVLANDTDADAGDTLTIMASAIVSGFGSITIEHGVLVYAPGTAYDNLAPGATATVEISYTVADSRGATSQASAILTVTGTNDGPVVHDKHYANDVGAQILGNVFADTGSGADADIDGGTLAADPGRYDTAAGGAVVIHANGDFVYTPPPGFSGADSFTYTVGDGQGATTTGTVGLAVVNEASTPQGVDVTLTGSTYGLGEKQFKSGIGWSEDDSQVASLKDGGYVVVWEAADGWGDGSVFFQRFSASGVATGDVTRTTNSMPFGGMPAVAGLEDGGFIITWIGDADPITSFNTHIFSQRFDASGHKIGPEFYLNESIGVGQSQHPAVVGLAGGGFAASWWQGGSTVARTFDADGVPLGGQVVLGQGMERPQGSSDIAALPNGGFVVTWCSYAPNFSIDGDISGRIFDASGVPVGPEFPVNAGPQPNRQVTPNVTVLEDGSFVVTWQDEDADTGPFEEWGCSGRRFDADGVPMGGNFRINTQRHGQQFVPDIAALEDGGFVAVWHSNPKDGSGSGIAAQRFAADGTMVGAEFQVNGYVLGEQTRPQVTGLADGGFVVSWSSLSPAGTEWDVYSQQFDANGQRLSAPNYYQDMAVPLAISAGLSDTDGSETLSYRISGLPDGAMLSAGTQDASGVWTLAQADLAGLRFHPPAGYIGQVHLSVAVTSTEITNGDQSTTTLAVDFEIRDPLGIYGTAGADTVNGTMGNDKLYGGAGNDEVNGGLGADILTGGAGNDTLSGGSGSDHFRFEAGTGSDRVIDFQGGAAGDFVDLAGTGISNYAQAQAAMTQQGGDVVLDFGGGNQVHFMNTLLADFDPTRFTYS